MDVLIALGSNLTRGSRTPLRICQEAVASLARTVGDVVARSRWYMSEPVPSSDQTWFVNGVVRLKTARSPRALLDILHRIEADAGRMRSERWAARTLDLDLLDYECRVVAGQAGLQLPHPRIAERAFVLVPMTDIAPAWRHPVTGLTPGEMLDRLPLRHRVTRLP